MTSARYACTCGAPVCESCQRKDSKEFNEGYLAEAHGKDMVKDNPYLANDPKHWQWRKGYIQAFKDSH